TKAVKRHDGGPTWLRVAGRLRPYGAHLSGLLALALLAPPLALLTPLPLKIAVDSFLGERPLPGFLDAVIPLSIGRTGVVCLGVAVALTIAVGLATQLRDAASSLLSTFTGERMLRDYRAELFRHVQRLSLSYH